MIKSFKENFTYENRIDESKRIKIKYPERIPVIVEKSSSSDISQVDKQKYLVPNDLSVAQFIYVIRKRIELPQEQALFLFVNNTLPHSSSLMSQIYHDHVDDDGFLYVRYEGETTFG